ncbi:hypothetical protein QBC37DRAFT_41474 [Rhypophila decipiens]|uniref:Uncharacterized protein n=1 Tax=Rhypophila decipiens TaxID=261697 RepID=A0AAN6Y142_9PEZI|nr:hypothetical protein QBC37DRAFT_41474 [Rhypophila decipiens]
MACYFPDGSEDDDFPCNPDARQSFCCNVGHACMSNGFCKPRGYDELPGYWLYTRGSCTDEQWMSDSCPNICIDSATASTWVHIADCAEFQGEGWLCCAKNTDDAIQGNCCDDDDALFYTTYGTVSTIIGEGDFVRSDQGNFASDDGEGWPRVDDPNTKEASDVGGVFTSTTTDSIASSTVDIDTRQTSTQYGPTTSFTAPLTSLRTSRATRQASPSSPPLSSTTPGISAPTYQLYIGLGLGLGLGAVVLSGLALISFCLYKKRRDKTMSGNITNEQVGSTPMSAHRRPGRRPDPTPITHSSGRRAEPAPDTHRSVRPTELPPATRRSRRSELDPTPHRSSRRAELDPATRTSNRRAELDPATCSSS